MPLSHEAVFSSSHGTASGLALRFSMVFLLAFAIAHLLPAQAHAFFNDVTDSFPATQDLGSYGAPITGSDLPDGSYQVKARTNSRMCIMYTNPADAEARDSKEQAIISVSGGRITAVFYISRRYTYLYFGTMEEAAAATNKKGTDASSYIAGDPAVGYVPHLFTLPIEALNKPLTISTYAGGYEEDDGLEQGMWYTRQFVFVMTDAELQKIKADAAAVAKAEEEARKAQEEQAAAEEEAARKAAEEEAARKAAEEEAARKAEEEENGKSDDGKTDKADETEPGADDGKQKAGDQNKESSSSSSSARGDKEDDGGAGGEDNQSASENAGAGQAVLSADNVVAQGAGGGPGGSSSDAGESGSPSGDGEGDGLQQGGQAGGGTGTAKMHGVRMTIATKDVVIDAGDDKGDAEDADDAGLPLLTQEQAVVLALLALLAVGALVRSVLYLRAFDGAIKSPVGELQGESRDENGERNERKC